MCQFQLSNNQFDPNEQIITYSESEMVTWVGDYLLKFHLGAAAVMVFFVEMESLRILTERAP